MYLRQNATEEFIGDLRDISQSTVSRIVTTLVPIIKAVLEEFVPDAKDAITMVQGRVCLPSSRGESRPPATRRVCLVDGTITPCWSYDEHPELWSRKKGTTGFNAQVISLLDGTPVYLSDPLPGKTHDALAFTETPSKRSFKNPAVPSPTRATKDTSRPLLAKHHPADNSANETKNATPRSPRCAHPSSASWHMSSPGAYSTQTTGVHTTPTATPTTPLAGCSSSQSTGVLNNALGSGRHPRPGRGTPRGNERSSGSTACQSLRSLNTQGRMRAN